MDNKALKKKKKSKVLPVLLTLLILGGIGAGAWFAYPILTGKAVGEELSKVYVTAVADITGMGYPGVNNAYMGVVEARDIVEIRTKADMTIAETFVRAGDSVKAGDPLFSYDAEALTLSYEQLLIEISGLENGIAAAERQSETLQKQIDKAKESRKYPLQLEKQEVDLKLKKDAYELKTKRAQAAEAAKILETVTVVSPVSGKIRSVKSSEGGSNYGGETSDAYITIVSGQDFTVKGTCSEQTIYTLQPGTPVIIRSRVDNSVWKGSIDRVNTEQAEKSNNFDGDGERASKYAFYVNPDSAEGLMIGQHVFLDVGATDVKGGMHLPEYYLVKDGDNTYVWAADVQNRMERRQVIVGNYDPEACTWEILSGLSLSDLIAFPEESVKAGAPAEKVAFGGGTDFEMPDDEDAEYGFIVEEVFEDDLTADGLDFDEGGIIEDSDEGEIVEDADEGEIVEEAGEESDADDAVNKSAANLLTGTEIVGRIGG